MEKYIGLLVQAATLAGVVCVFLVFLWLFERSRLTSFRKMALAFMCAGGVIPLAILPIWIWINRHGSFSAISRIQDIAGIFWPTSIELMALDSPGPSPWSAVAFVYAFSVLGNIGTYGVIGLVWSSVYVRFGRSSNG